MNDSERRAALSLETLLQQAQHGDQAAAGLLLERVTVSCQHVIRRIFQGYRDEIDVADVLQQTYLVLLGHFDKGTRIDNVRSFANAIASNQAKTFVTENRGDRHRRLQQEVLSAETEHPHPGESRAERVLEARSQLKTMAQRLVPQLSPPERRVFQLHLIEGLEIKEVASQLGISRNYVDQHLNVIRRLAKNIREPH